jgi:hypothetical protein
MSKSVSNETGILSEADEIAALLPWYVSGKISAQDRAKVEAYAGRNPEVRAHITLARDEADVVFASNQEIAPPRAALDNLKASLAASPGARFSSAKASLLDRLGTFLDSLTPRQLAYAGLAAALALAVQTASIGALLSGQTGGYQTAAGAKACVDKGSFALIALQRAAPAGTLSAFLAENKMKIVEGPVAGGMYRVCVSGDVLSKGALDAAIAKIKARADLVSFVSAAPGQ